jgi:hypothetical protein
VPEAAPLQEDGTHDLQEVAQGIQQRELLEEQGHGVDRVEEARENDGGEHDQEHGQEGLLLGRRDRRDQEAHSQPGQNEQPGGQQQRSDRAPERDPEPEEGHRRHQRELDQGDQGYR